MGELQTATEILEHLKSHLSNFGPNTNYDPATAAKTLDEIKVECFNATDGDRNQKDGYDCPLCRNRGVIAKLVTGPDGQQKVTFADCGCVDIRNTISRMQRSGRADVIKKFTFKTFNAENDFQQKMKEAAQAYVKAEKGWFFMGGQSGCGKSHLGTAIFREFLLAGKSAQYMAWREDAARLKKLLGRDDMSYCEEVDRLKTAAVLYIDDLFKTGKTDGNQVQRPTAADINLAFEILNYRANHPDTLTIISSECTLRQLIEIDEAIAGRIAEFAKPYVLSINPDPAKNYRLRDVVEL